MSITPVQSNPLVESIERMNELLKQITGAKMNLDDSLMKVNVRSTVEGTKIEGLGEIIDLSA